MLFLEVIIVALYYMLQSLGILNRLAPKSLADTGIFATRAMR